MSFSDYFEVAILNLVTGGTHGISGVTGTMTPYLALMTGTLSGDTPGTEATGGGYARVAVAGKWAAPTSGAGSIVNNATITFATFTGSVSSGAAITHVALFDAITGGNPILYGTLTDITKTFGNSDIAQLPSGSITLIVD